MSHAAETQKAGFNNDTDADLLTIIGWRPDEEAAARDAWGEFYGRHFEFLSVVCLRAYRNQLGDAGVEDLVNDTFLHVFAHAARTFQTEETNPANIRKLVRAWLRAVAHNLFLMARRGRKGMNEVLTEVMDYILCKNDPPMPPERLAECERVREIVDSLSERERDVLFARFWNYDAAGDKQSFENEVLGDLVERWNTTDVNIRQILSRTLKKIKDRLS